MAAVRQHLAACPEAHLEVAELGAVTPALLQAVEPVAPPAALGVRIMAAAEAERQQALETRRATDVMRAADTQRTERLPAIEPEGSLKGWFARLFQRPVWAGAGMAAALALVALGAWNLQLRAEIEGLAAYRNGVVAVLDEAAQPGAQLALLRVPEGATGPSGFAAVAQGGTTVSLVMRDLAPTSGTEVYEAWVIAGDNAPVPVGSFTVDASGTANFVSTRPSSTDAAVITVALTREKAPGATTPTLPIVAVGTAG